MNLRMISSKMFVVTCLILLSSVSNIGVVGGSNYLRNDVVIIFDKENPTTQSMAERVFNLVIPLYPHVDYSPISSINELKQETRRFRWVAIYIFHGEPDSMIIKNEKLPWEDLRCLIQASLTKFHIIESCYSDCLTDNPEKLTRIHGIQGNVDVELATIDAIHWLMEAFEISKDPKKIDFCQKTRLDQAHYVYNHLSKIILRALNPCETLGSDLEDMLINLPRNETLIRGPWGWLVNTLLDNWLARKITNIRGEWYDVVKNPEEYQVSINKERVRQGVMSLTDINKEDLGSGNDTTGNFPFDIPLVDINIEPQLGTGPWYFPEYVDLKFEVKPEKGTLDFVETPIGDLLEAAGFEVEIEISPKLWCGVRVGNFIEKLSDMAVGECFQFLGGGFSLTFNIEVSIPIAAFLNSIIPGTGAGVAKALDILGIEASILGLITLNTGISYDGETESSIEEVLLKFGIGLLIEFELPSVGALLKKATGFNIPIDIVKLGVKMRGESGVESKAEFGPKGDIFEVDLYIELLFKFWAELFWFLKFDWTEKWSNDFPLTEHKTEAEDANHTNMDVDETVGDGLWDEIEADVGPLPGLDPNKLSTDDDDLSDGNEIYEFLTNPHKRDSDEDWLWDGEEVGWFYHLQLDPFADYDGDMLHCLLDRDSDNDGLGDGDWTYSPNDELEGERAIGTDPTVRDTDYDGLLDGEEWYILFGRTFRTNPLSADTDGDWLFDGFEYEYYLNRLLETEKSEYGPTGDFDGDGIVNIHDRDSDNDLLLDGIEVLNYGTDPLDIDTDGDYDLNENNIIDPDERLAPFQFKNPDWIIEGNLTDYGEINGNYWPEGPFGADPQQCEGKCVYPWPLQTNPLSNDTDGDGYLDREEWVLYSPPNSTDVKNPAYFDADSDGLGNAEECSIYLTDCTNPDTDHDGLKDGWERDYYISRGIDPLDTDKLGAYLRDMDVDDDLLRDGEELLIGTDPLNADTDYDGLIDSSEKYKLGSYMLFWSDPLDPDTDDDGLNDYIEANKSRTDPLRKDTDNDGLTDFTEYNQIYTLNILNVGVVSYMTDPLDPDTDDDTISDGEEVHGWSWAINRTVPKGSSEFLPAPMPVEPELPSQLKLINFPDPYRARYQTNPAENDTDSDGLVDGYEKKLKLSPITNDTDGDGMSDMFEVELMEDRFPGIPTKNLPDTWHYLDFDHDGLTDLNETMMGTDILFNDTDSDGLDDWHEIGMPVSFTSTTVETRAPCQDVIVNEGLTKLYTDPLNPDTDNDGLLDGEEMSASLGTDPLVPDSDNDGLTDFEEAHFNLTDPLDPDTDGDNIMDGDEAEYFGFMCFEDTDGDGLANLIDPDSDQDGIYDGVELYNYTSGWAWSPLGSDPLDADQNQNNIIDGYETDYDLDGLSDWKEVYETPPGYMEPTPESLLKGKYNGTLAFVNHTYFFESDTDKDTWNDYEEIVHGTDPLDPTSHTLQGIQIILTPSQLITCGINLHVYDNQSRHIGFNHESYSIDKEIPKATYHNFYNGTTRIFLPPEITDFQILIDGSYIPISQSANSAATVNTTSSILSVEYNLHITVYDNGEVLDHVEMSKVVEPGKTEEIYIQITDDRQVISEFPPIILLTLFMMIALLGVLMSKRKFAWKSIKDV